MLEEEEITGKIPAPISSSAVDPEGSSGCLFSAFLQAQSTLRMLLQQHSLGAADAGLPQVKWVCI